MPNITVVFCWWWWWFFSNGVVFQYTALSLYFVALLLYHYDKNLNPVLPQFMFGQLTVQTQGFLLQCK